MTIQCCDEGQKMSACAYSQRAAYYTGVTVATVKRTRKGLSNFHKFNYYFVYISIIFAADNQHTNTSEIHYSILLQEELTYFNF
jgi:hypothetical protein